VDRVVEAAVVAAFEPVPAGEAAAGRDRCRAVVPREAAGGHEALDVAYLADDFGGHERADAVDLGQRRASRWHKLAEAPLERAQLPSMRRRSASRSRASSLCGELLAGAAVAVVTDRVDPGDRLVWVAPAGTVAVILAGLMLGFLFGEEIKDGREDKIADAEATPRRGGPRG
jgi:hypothetical protein